MVTGEGRDFVHTPQRTYSGVMMAQSVRYRAFRSVRSPGRVWLVGDSPNAGDFVYMWEPEEPTLYSFQGFGGAVLHFTLVNGCTMDLEGPWHSGAQALYDDTGVDVRHKCLSLGVLALHRVPDAAGLYRYKYLLYKEEAPQLGVFERVGLLAQWYANKLGATVFYYRESVGSSEHSYRKPTVPPPTAQYTDECPVSERMESGLDEKRCDELLRQAETYYDANRQHTPSCLEADTDNKY